MQQLIASYKIVTPMFIGGADQSPSDGIRPPSVKGVLRFWWRALNWGRFWYESNKNEENALNALNKEEARLFGASMGDDTRPGGQGSFLLSIQQPENIKKSDNWPPDNPNNGASYMAYGLLSTNDEAHRFAIEDGVEFRVKLVFKNSETQKDDLKQIRNTLEAWSLFGGLGGRMRRAMGSITLTEFNSNQVLFTQQEYEKKVNEIIATFDDIPQAPFSAFSMDSSVCFMKTGNNSRTLVTQLGSDYKAFRSQKNLRGKKKIPFGLPLKDVDEESRRASPLFFHIHQLQKKEFISMNLFLPAKYFHMDKKYNNLSMEIVKQYASKGMD